MNIKICGLSTKSAVDAAVKNGATHIGFVMSPSRRQVSAETVKAITSDVPKSVKKVGLFVNESLEFVKDAIAQADFDMVQLHGNEDMTYIRALRALTAPDFPVIKAISDFVSADRYENVILLLDSPSGGSGQQWDWASVSTDRLTLPYFIAGGLTPDNVVSALQHFPTTYGMDVSSGVETDGQKDVSKIAQFIRNVKDF